MTSRLMLRGTALLTVGCALGCNEFDSNLEALIDEGVAGAGGMSSSVSVANTCDAPALPIFPGASESFGIRTEGLTSAAREAGECGISPGVLGRSDAFFKIDTNAGQRWHFHLDAVDGVDMAVHVADSCDLRTCVSGADVCTDGESEHFTFVAERTGEFVVTLEGVDPAAAEEIVLLAINPICGDGNKEHSEVCDDGNIDDGDGCDRWCREELTSADDDEVEPNDDSFGANVLAAAGPGDSRSVLASIGGSCQPDFYLLEVTDDATVDLSVTFAVGDECAGAPPLELALFDADGQTLRTEALRGRDEGGDQDCPVLSGVALTRGFYFVRVSEPTGADPYDYRLNVTLDP